MTSVSHFGSLTGITGTKSTTGSTSSADKLSKQDSEAIFNFIMDNLEDTSQESTDVLTELLESEEILSMLDDEVQTKLNELLDDVVDGIKTYTKESDSSTTTDSTDSSTTTDSTDSSTKTDSSEDTSKTSSSKNYFNLNDSTKEYTTDENGVVTSMYDKDKNFTTKYEYDSDGNLISSSTYASDGKTLMHECKYDENGRVSEKHEFISEGSRTEGEYTHKFTYDEFGRLETSKVYKGDDTSVDPIGDYVFKYPSDDSNQPSSRTNLTNGSTSEFKYDDNGKLQEQIDKDKDGNETGTKIYNPDGTVASVVDANENTVTRHEYDKDSPYISEVKTYNIDNIGDGDDAIDKATPSQTAYYKGGKLSAEVQGDYTYVYDYTDGVKTTKKYKTEDCENGVPKENAEPVSTEDSTSSTSDSTTSTGESSSDAVKVAQNNSDRSSKIIQQSIEDAGGGTAWCSEFVKNVLKESGQYDKLASWYKDLPEEMDAGKNAAYSIYNAATSADAVVSASEAKPGDIIIFKDANGNAVHTGMVEKIENGNVYTIEGGGEGGSFTNVYNVNDEGLSFCKVMP